MKTTSYPSSLQRLTRGDNKNRNHPLVSRGKLVVAPMTSSCRVFLFSLLLSAVCVHSAGPAPLVERLTDRFSRVGVNQSYDILFGGKNVRGVNGGGDVTLTLDKSSGSGVESRDRYFHGFFSAAIKLPAGFSSGVVVAFYLSNVGEFPHNHDELDFELLGHESKRTWVLQTNMYGDGSVGTGREEKLYLWFDPTEAFHEYSILWNHHHIVYFVDNVPVREVAQSKALGSAYPSKPMSAYITIWDGSEWATHGGKYPVDYKYAPFVASISGVQLEGCVMDQNQVCSGRSPSSLDPVDGEVFAKLSSSQTAALDWARRNHMFYSYCQDRSRYKVMPPEC